MKRLTKHPPTIDQTQSSITEIYFTYYWHLTYNPNTCNMQIKYTTKKNSECFWLNFISFYIISLSAKHSFEYTNKVVIYSNFFQQMIPKSTSNSNVHTSFSVELNISMELEVYPLTFNFIWWHISKSALFNDDDRHLIIIIIVILFFQ